LPEPVSEDGSHVDISYNLGQASTFIKYDEASRTFSLKDNSESILADFQDETMMI